MHYAVARNGTLIPIGCGKKWGASHPAIVEGCTSRTGMEASFATTTRMQRLTTVNVMENKMEHVLYKNGDTDLPDNILDRNGELALHMCRVCGLAESELDNYPTCPGLKFLKEFQFLKEFLDAGAKNKEQPAVPEILNAAAETFAERSAVYGDSYKNAGAFYAALFPTGLAVNTPEEWNRLCVFLMIGAKFMRYSNNIASGGHKDSAHDMIVYAAMLEELTK